MDQNRYRERPVNNHLPILTSWVDNEACPTVVHSW